MANVFTTLLKRSRDFGRKIKVYAAAHPYQFALITAGIILGIAAIGVGMAFSGGAIAVPAAIGASVLFKFFAGTIAAHLVIGMGIIVSGGLATAGLAYYANHKINHPVAEQKHVTRQSRIKSSNAHVLELLQCDSEDKSSLTDKEPAQLTKPSQTPVLKSNSPTIPTTSKTESNESAFKIH